MRRMIKLNEFFSACVQLVEGSDQIIRQVRQNIDLKTQTKGKSAQDVFTEADMMIQKTIHYNLSQLYPRATIIGEEDDEDTTFDCDKPYMHPDQINMHHVSENMLLENYNRIKSAFQDNLQELEHYFGNKAYRDLDWNFYEFPDEFYEDDMVIWIDPLDGTKGFVEGHLNHIASMIGVSINKRPRIGIIHKPFYGHNYQGRTYFGTPECGLFIKDKFPEQLKRLQRITPVQPFKKDVAIDDEDYEVWVIGSHNKNQDIMGNILNAMKPEHIVRAAGSGNKFIQLLDKRAEIYLNLVPGLKYWDMCASEALMMARMGIVTDAKGEHIIYDHQKKDRTVREGIIAAKNLKVYNTCINRIRQELGMSISELHAQMQEHIQQAKIQRKIEQVNNSETWKIPKFSKPQPAEPDVSIKQSIDL